MKLLKFNRNVLAQLFLLLVGFQVFFSVLNMLGDRSPEYMAGYMTSVGVLYLLLFPLIMMTSFAGISVHISLTMGGLRRALGWQLAALNVICCAVVCASQWGSMWVLSRMFGSDSPVFLARFPRLAMLASAGTLVLGGLGLLAGLWLLTEAGTNIGMLVFGTEKTEWQSASGVVALFGVALAVLLVAIVQYSSNFELAVSMGRTRKGYLVSAFVANLAFALVFALAAYPLSWVSELMRRVLFPAMPLAGSSALASNYGLTVFHHMAWVIPMGALTAAVLGMVMGALCQRWGQYGFLVIWLGGIALGTLLGKVAELYAAGKTGVFTPLLDTVAAFFSAVLAWGTGGVVALWLAVLALLYLIGYMALRKAPVKGI